MCRRPADAFNARNGFPLGRSPVARPRVLQGERERSNPSSGCRQTAPIGAPGPIGAEGLDLPNALGGCIAATAEEIAAAVSRLHNNKKANATCRAAGLRYVEEVFSEARLDALMQQVLGPAIRESAKIETAAAR
jgi:hypothetical protein